VTGVREALWDLMQAWQARVVSETGRLPCQEYDPQWPSPCQLGPPDAQGRILWQPVIRDEPADFTGLENALEEPVHPSIKEFYGSFWSDPFDVWAPEGRLSLLQVWNDSDFDRLVANLLGHVLTLRRARRPLTLFFACTDEDDYFLSVDNRGGDVWLETPGAPPIRQLAPSLRAFLLCLRSAPEGGEAGREKGAS